jgi:hypothetical protein
VDVIIEGKITPEEGIAEVLQTLIDLKTVAYPVLRINCTDSRFQGKIGFAQGGFLLGAKVEETGELGYPAVRKLLLVRNGNYAILDPEKQIVLDVNQSLWIDLEKILQVLPDLPASPEGLLSPHASTATTTLVADRFEEAAATSKKASEKASVSGVNSKTRQFDPAHSRRRYAILFLWAVVIMVSSAAFVHYSDVIWSTIHTVLAH